MNVAWVVLHCNRRIGATETADTHVRFQVPFLGPESQLKSGFACAGLLSWKPKLMQCITPGVPAHLSQEPQSRSEANPASSGGNLQRTELLMTIQFNLHVFDDTWDLSLFNGKSGTLAETHNMLFSLFASQFVSCTVEVPLWPPCFYKFLDLVRSLSSRAITFCVRGLASDRPR